MALPEGKTSSILSILAESSLCRFSVATELSADATQHLFAADPAPAGRRGARRKKATIHQLDQNVLNKIFTKLAPEALAIAGLQEHSA